jgi:hypothetical protein
MEIGHLCYWAAARRAARIEGWRSGAGLQRSKAERGRGREQAGPEDWAKTQKERMNSFLFLFNIFKSNFQMNFEFSLKFESIHSIQKSNAAA